MLFKGNKDYYNVWLKIFCCVLQLLWLTVRLAITITPREKAWRGRRTAIKQSKGYHVVRSTSLRFVSFLLLFFLSFEMKLDVRVYVRSKEDSFYRETDLRSNNAAAVDGLVGEVEKGLIQYLGDKNLLLLLGFRRNNNKSLVFQYQTVHWWWSSGFRRFDMFVQKFTCMSWLSTQCKRGVLKRCNT